MHIGILGSGNMGQGLASLLAKAGHRIALGDRDPVRAEANAQGLGGGVTGTDLASAARGTDLVILALPYEAAAEVVAEIGGLAGQTVIDISNPVRPDYSGLSIGHTTSAAEEIQKAAPEAKVVKAFNTTFAQVLQAGGRAGGEPATVFVAGDDEGARGTVADLVQGLGLRAIDAGDLTAARLLEPLGMLNIRLGYGLGRGTDIAPAWLGNA
ncbi:Putative reductase [Rubellimicrobium mesophilum DSM 19309]|uniref:Putative reductase n=1 Tax=Rubellimicrobium mesophilum DSM 19309 TaxID=442562 RepID=A0A017HRN0_9RHOB|nr:Putative reductase [Rubellimicrobium mesophilum DSM 19309]